MPLLNHRYIKDTLIIEMNDLASRNAFSISMAEEFIQLLHKESPQSILLTNTGPSFCSGGNLKFYKSLNTKEEGLAINKRIQEILDEFDKMAIAKACWVNGTCYGGGIEVISAFDHIVAHPASLFGLWQRRVGLSFGWGGGKRLLRRLPEKALKSWFLKAETVSSYEAEKRGLVDQVSLDGFNEALSWAQQSQKHGKESLSHVNLAFTEEAQCFSELWLSEKHRDVLNRFK